MTKKAAAVILAAGLTLSAFSASASYVRQAPSEAVKPQSTEENTVVAHHRHTHRHCHITLSLGHAKKKCHTHKHPIVVHHGVLYH